MTWPLVELRHRALELARQKQAVLQGAVQGATQNALALPKVPSALPHGVPPELVKLLDLLVTQSAHPQTLAAIASADDIIIDQHQRSLADRLVRFIIIDENTPGERDQDGHIMLDLSPLPGALLELDVILVRQGVKATLTLMTEHNAHVPLQLRHEIMLEQDASLTLHVAHCATAGSYTRQTMLLGAGSRLEDNETVIVRGESGAGGSTLSLDNVVVHAAKGTSANVLQCGIVLEGAANAAGFLRVLPRSQKTETFLAQHWLLFSETQGAARATASPMLEIEADDVRASHCATVRPIDEEQQFYLEQRGIPRKQARTMLATSLLGESLGRWPAASREKIDSKVSMLLEARHG